MKRPPGISAKVARAHEHLDVMTGEIRAWMDEQRDEGRVEEKVLSSETSVRMGLHFTRPPPLVRWGVMLGDFAHCVRSGLDHLAYALAVEGSGQSPPPNQTRVAFPICTARDHFRRFAAKRLADVSNEAIEAMEAVQPYLRGNSTVLWMVHEVNRQDKHQLVQPILMAPGRLRFAPGQLQALGVRSISWDNATDFSATFLTFHLREWPDSDAVPLDIRTSYQIGVSVAGCDWRLPDAGLLALRELDRVIDALDSHLTG